MALNCSSLVSDDIRDRLPSDPFEMDMNPNFNAMGWLHDLDDGYGGYSGIMDRDFLWSSIWNSAVMFQPFLDNIHLIGKLNMGTQPFGDVNVYEESSLYYGGGEETSGMGEKVHFPGSDLEMRDRGGSRGYGVNVGNTDVFDVGSSKLQPGARVEGCLLERPCDVGNSAVFEVGSSKLQSGDEVECPQFERPIEIERRCDVGNSDVFAVGSSSEVEVCRFQTPCNVGNIVSDVNWSSSLQSGDKVEDVVCSDSEEAPHEALGFALGYLGVKDLLSVERVCRSLCSTVREDSLLWKDIRIDKTLNDKITDDLLVQLARRAAGYLESLSLVECTKVTDDGLRRVLEINRRLMKLSISGCTRIAIEGVVNNIKMHNSLKDVKGIKHLRIGGIFGLTRENFEELRLLIGANDNKIGRKEHIYDRRNLYIPLDDDRSIDVEECPRCAEVRLVYDCPAEGCQDKYKVAATGICRACRFCIPRCDVCGRCLDNKAYEETFSFESVCLDCVNEEFKYHGRPNHHVECEGETIGVQCE